MLPEDEAKSLAHRFLVGGLAAVDTGRLAEDLSEGGPAAAALLAEMRSAIQAAPYGLTAQQWTQADAQMTAWIAGQRGRRRSRGLFAALFGRRTRGKKQEVGPRPDEASAKSESHFVIILAAILGALAAVILVPLVLFTRPSMPHFSIPALLPLSRLASIFPHATPTPRPLPPTPQPTPTAIPNSAGVVRGFATSGLGPLPVGLPQATPAPAGEQTRLLGTAPPGGLPY